MEKEDIQNVDTEHIKEMFMKAGQMKKCKMCGASLGQTVYEQGEGVCFKHWDV